MVVTTYPIHCYCCDTPLGTTDRWGWVPVGPGGDMMVSCYACWHSWRVGSAEARQAIALKANEKWKYRKDQGIEHGFNVKANRV